MARVRAAAQRGLSFGSRYEAGESLDVRRCTRLGRLRRACPARPHEGKYLIVEERDGTFFLPAGKVEPGENLMAAAARETAEEAGVMVGLRGILGLDHSQLGNGNTKLRFAFVGCPAIVGRPKDTADHHSRSAGRFTKAEVQGLPLRNPEVLTWIERYELGTPLLPCASYEPLEMGTPPRAWSARIS